MTKEDFFKKLDQLLALKTLTPKEVGQLLSLGMVKREDEGNEFFDVYSATGDEKNAIREAELRVPLRANEARGGILILHPGAALRVTLEEVRQRFGKNAVPSPPDPRAPQSTPVYYSYRQRGARLSFGFSRDEEPKLTSVVIDRTEADE